MHYSFSAFLTKQQDHKKLLEGEKGPACFNNVSLIPHS